MPERRPTKEQIRKELERTGRIAVDYLMHANVLKRESGLSVPLITPQDISQISPHLEPLQRERNPLQADRAIELPADELIRQFSRDFEKVGPNFRTGAGFAFAVFGRLNKIGFNFPPVQEETVKDFTSDYQKYLERFARDQKIEPNAHTTRTEFIKTMLLFGFLAPQLHENENPNLMNLFKSYSSSRMFAQEGSILVYELKMAEYLKSLGQYRTL